MDGGTSGEEGHGGDISLTHTQHTHTRYAPLLSGLGRTGNHGSRGKDKTSCWKINDKRTQDRAPRRPLCLLG